MNLVVVSGSHRSPSNSSKVARYLAARALETWKDEVSLLDLGSAPLPLWDEGVWNDDPLWRDAWGPAAAALAACDALVLVTPEWGGMATPALKNFLLLCDAKLVGHKPALLVAVSGGQGGAYPIAELRMSATKNNRLCFVPEHVIVRAADRVLTDFERPADPHDGRVRAHLAYGLGILRAYGAALRQVRASGAVDHAQFPHGM